MKSKYHFQYTILERLDNGTFREVVKASPQTSFPRSRAYVAQSLMRLRSIRGTEGSLGRHHWHLDRAAAGFSVHVDGRRIGTASTAIDGASTAMRMIGRVVADGDYLLSDKPFGFAPPLISC